MIRDVDSRGFAPASTMTRAAMPQPGAFLRFKLLTSLAAVGLLVMPGSVTAAPKPTKQKFSTETPLTPFQPTLSDSSTFSFTASGGNAASARLQTVERAFRFTPSGQSDNRKALSIGLNTRVVAPAADRSRAAAPVEAVAAAPRAYNVDLSAAGLSLRRWSAVIPWNWAAPIQLRRAFRSAVESATSWRR